jgi:hypothetical protein
MGIFDGFDSVVCLVCVCGWRWSCIGAVHTQRSEFYFQRYKPSCASSARSPSTIDSVCMARTFTIYDFKTSEISLMREQLISSLHTPHLVTLISPCQTFLGKYHSKRLGIGPVPSGFLTRCHLRRPAPACPCESSKSSAKPLFDQPYFLPFI